MPVRIEPQSEPIPGYKLLERLGSGGFGEVWKAEAPGGLLKAIKFVHGDIEAVDDSEGARAGQELKAMDRVRKVRHAYILSIERFEIIEGQLIIVTELADRTLWDRFKECNRDGLRGVPRDELLGYLGEAAEALDYMNEEYDLQHLDIKPQNLFLVHKHVKVADFGLAKDLGGKAAATVTGGVTPVYAAPETFDGWLSHFSDQYSLAIVYQELLTGKRPFSGGTMRQLVMQHLQAAPDLGELPASDQAVVARALSKNPESRFTSCVGFVNALREAAIPAQRPPAPRSNFNRAAAHPGTAPTMRPGDPGWDQVEVTVCTPGKVRHTSPPSPASDYDKPSLENRPQVLPPRPDRKKDAPAKHEPQIFLDTPDSDRDAFDSDKTSMVGRSRTSDHDLRVCDGVGQPALVLGLGGLGRLTLQQLRGWLSEEVGPPEATPRIRLLAIDTDPETVQEAGLGQAPAKLRNTEVLLAKLQRPAHYLKPRDGALPLDSWLNTKLLYRIPRQQEGAGLRALGRLAFVERFAVIARRLETELEKCLEPAATDSPVPDALGARSLTPRVYIVAGLGGNTGGGMFLDAAYVVRHVLRKLGHSNAEVVGLFLLPDPDREGIRSTALANVYAALLELNYFSSGQIFSARYEEKASARPFTEAGPPFQRAFVLSLPALQSACPEPAQAVALAGQFLYRDLATQLGVVLDQARRESETPYELVGQTAFHSFGLYRVYWPRRRMLTQAARAMCARLVKSWTSKDAGPISAEIRKWSHEQWDALELRAENLIARHQEQCEINLKRPPEHMFQDIINPLAKTLASPDQATGLSFGPVIQVMAHLDRLLGVPEEGRAPGKEPPEPGVLETALAEAAALVAEECEQKLAESVVRIIEQPTFRLAGAEECLRQFSTIVEQALGAQEHLARELQERSVQLHQRIISLLEKPVSVESRSTSLWTFGRKTPTQAPQNLEANIVELLKAYPKCRYQSLILFHINRLYVALRGLLSDQIREVGFCRQRLDELAGLFKDEPRDKKREKKTTRAAHEEALLPTVGADIDAASKQLEVSVSAEEFLKLDQNVQALIDKEFRALVQVCLGPSHVVKTLAPLMVREAEAILGPHLEGISVADMFMKASEDRQALTAAVQKRLAAAESSLGQNGDRREEAFAIVPDGAAGAELHNVLEETCAGLRTVQGSRSDEIVLYRQRLHISTAQLDQAGALAQEAYRQKQAVDPGSLHNREDIEAWQTAARAIQPR